MPKLIHNFVNLNSKYPSSSWKALFKLECLRIYFYNWFPHLMPKHIHNFVNLNSKYPSSSWKALFKLECLRIYFYNWFPHLIPKLIHNFVNLNSKYPSSSWKALFKLECLRIYFYSWFPHLMPKLIHNFVNLNSKFMIDCNELTEVDHSESYIVLLCILTNSFQHKAFYNILLRHNSLMLAKRKKVQKCPKTSHNC